MIEFTSETIWSGLLFVGVFLITNSIPLPVVGLFRFSIFSWFSFSRLFFLGIYPCLLGVQFVGVHNILMRLCICVVTTVMLPLSFIVLFESPHFLWWVLLVKVEVLIAQLCLTLCDPMDCSLLGSSVHGILQARILEWVAIPFSRGSSQPKDWTQVSCFASRLFTIWATLYLMSLVKCLYILLI